MLYFLVVVVIAGGVAAAVGVLLTGVLYGGAQAPGPAWRPPTALSRDTLEQSK